MDTDQPLGDVDADLLERARAAAAGYPELEDVLRRLDGWTNSIWNISRASSTPSIGCSAPPWATSRHGPVGPDSTPNWSAGGWPGRVTTRPT